MVTVVDCDLIFVIDVSGVFTFFHRVTDGRFVVIVFVCVCFYACNACNNRSVLDLMMNEGLFHKTGVLIAWENLES